MELLTLFLGVNHEWGVAKKCLPVLSAQLMTAPTGRPKAIRNLAPAEPPRPGNKLKYYKC